MIKKQLNDKNLLPILNNRFELNCRKITQLNFNTNYKLLFLINSYLDYFMFNYINKVFIGKSDILFYDLIHTYIGSRHLRGLPVHGQRTWTNAWNTYKTNTTLREIKLGICKNLYNSSSMINYPIVYLSEHINLIWKTQWQHEWRFFRKKRLFFLKNSYGLYKIDLFSLSSRSFVNINKLKKKTKKASSKSSFALGFDINFTKSLLKLLNSNTSSKLKVQILWNSNKK